MGVELIHSGMLHLRCEKDGQFHLLACKSDDGTSVPIGDEWISGNGLFFKLCQESLGIVHVGCMVHMDRKWPQALSGVSGISL